MRPHRIGFVVEQILGHQTHYGDLRTAIEADGGVEPVWLPVSPESDDGLNSLPVLGNHWLFLASFRGRRAVVAADVAAPLDAVLFHTQTAALMSARLMRRIPSVISLDVTPLQMEGMRTIYNAGWRMPLAFRGKDLVARHCLRRARHLVAWSGWVRDSLVEDYGLTDDRIDVISGGVDTAHWDRVRTSDRAASASAVRSPAAREPVRLLFVGGDFTRKGGPILLRALAHLPAGSWVLDAVTYTSHVADSRPEVRLHAGLPHNSPELLSLFANADVFVLPSTADCMPMVLMEAMAAGLPVIGTRVGAVGEMIEDGRTGLLTEAGDEQGLAAALARLIADPALRLGMGEAGRRRAQERFDASANCRLLLNRLKRVAEEGRRGRPR